MSSKTREPITFTVAAWNDDVTERTRLEGVTVCEMDTTRCGITDHNGRTVLRLPIGEETAFTVDHPEYAPAITALIFSPGLVEFEQNMVSAEKHSNFKGPFRFAS